MLIGGQAVLVHGRPRVTEDVDVTLAAGPERLDDALRACADLGLDVLPEDPRRFVTETLVLPARDPGTGLRVDLIFSTTPYEREAVARAVPVPLAGTTIPVASAEDLILHKLFAGRGQDLEDVASIVRRRGDALDWAHLERWAKEFAGVPGRETMPEAVKRLRSSR